MRTWIPFEEIEEELMRDPSFAEGVRLAEIRLDQRLAAERAQDRAAVPVPRVSVSRHAAA